MPEQRKFCTFGLDGLLYGLDVHDVQEILPAQSVTPVPLASHLVKGLINLRGQIVAVVDLRTCLQLPERPMERGPVHVVVRTAEDPISFLVDEAGGVVEASEAAFEAPPSTMEGPVLELIRGVYKRP